MIEVLVTLAQNSADKPNMLTVAVAGGVIGWGLDRGLAYFQIRAARQAALCNACDFRIKLNESRDSFGQSSSEAKVHYEELIESMGQKDLNAAKSSRKRLCDVLIERVIPRFFGVSYLRHLDLQNVSKAERGEAHEKLLTIHVLPALERYRKWRDTINHEVFVSELGLAPLRISAATVHDFLRLSDGLPTQPAAKRLARKLREAVSLLVNDDTAGSI